VAGALLIDETRDMPQNSGFNSILLTIKLHCALKPDIFRTVLDWHGR
jgi:hypothetical protein